MGRTTPKKPKDQRAVERAAATGTYWNGELTPARRVRVIVGEPPVATWWFADLVGTERAAVEVTYGGHTFLLDDEDGSGWDKVTLGRGSPRVGHRSLEGTVI